MGEGVLDAHPHHNFGVFIDTKINLKKVQSILYTVMMKKKKNQLFMLAVMLTSTMFLVKFHKYPEF